MEDRDDDPPDGDDSEARDGEANDGPDELGAEAERATGVGGDDEREERDESDWFERAIGEDESPEESAGSGRRSGGDEAKGETTSSPASNAPAQSPPSEHGGEGTESSREDDAGEEFESDFSEAFGGEAEPGPDDLGMEEAAPEDFGFDTAGGGGESEESFGFDMGAGERTETFDEADFESDIPRIDFGVEGLDDMVHGGVPERSLIVSIGGAGTGKTTFGLQFLAEALESGERAVFITLEESHDRIVQSAEEKGWGFEQYEADGDLAIIDLDPIEMANSLSSIRSELPRLIEGFGASRLVLDSVSLLEMMYDEQAVRRTEIYDFTRSLKKAGVTTLLTSEADAENPYASRYGIIEYLTDAVVVLRYVRPENFRETRLAVEIQKIRDANHSRETKPYEITDSGISVYQQANIF
ncbi:MAG: KaiC domain-containing protein [Halanaeroarchaeum sp.]